MGVGGKSGKKLAVKAWKFEFKQTWKTGGSLVDIEPVTQLSKNYKRWIYVFLKKGKKYVLWDEIEVRGKKDFKVYRKGSLTKGRAKEKVEKVYTTILPKNISYNTDTWQIDDLRVFSSEIKLSDKRVKEYSNNLATVVPKKGKGPAIKVRVLDDRAAKTKVFSPDKYSSGTSASQKKSMPYWMVLEEYLAWGRQLQKDYLTTREKLEKTTGDEDRALRMRLAWLTKQVVDGRNKPHWVRKTQLEGYLKKEKNKIEQLSQKEQSLSNSKHYMLIAPGFNATQYDYSGTTAQEKEIRETSAYIIKDTFKGKYGRICLEKIVVDPGNWYTRFLNDQSFEIGKKTYGFLSKEADVVLTIWEQWALAAAQLEGTKASKVKALLRRYSRVSRRTQLQYLEQVANLLGRRIGDLDAGFSNKLFKGKFFSLESPFPSGDPRNKKLPNTLNFALKGEANAKVAKRWKLHERLTGTHAKLSENVARVAFVLNAISVQKALHKLNDAAKKGDAWTVTEEALGLSSAVGDMMGSMELLLGKQLGKKSFQIVGIVAGVLDYAGDLTKLSHAVWDNKWKQVPGHIAGAAANACLVIGAVYGLKAVAAAGTAAAAGLAGAAAWWTGVGALIAIGAMIYLLTMAESPLKVWMKKSPWGINPKKASYNKKDIAKALNELQDLVAGFLVQVDNHPHFKLNINWGMLTKRSTLKLNIKIVEWFKPEKVTAGPTQSSNRGDTKVFKTNWDILKEKHSNNTYAKTWTHQQIKSQCGFNKQAHHYSYHITARLDLNGDGNWLIPSGTKPYETSGSF